MRTRNILLITIVIGLCLFVRLGCLSYKIDKLETTNSLLQVEKQEFKKVVNTQGDTILKQKAVIVKDKEQLKTFTDSIFKLKQEIKNVITYYREITTITWDTVYIPYVDTQYIPNPLLQTGDTITKELKAYINNSIQVPNSFYKDSLLFTIKGQVTKEGVRIDSLNIPDTFNLRIVETKGKLFKPSFVEFQSFHSNKLVKVTGANSILYKLPRKTFWQVVLDKLIWIGVGIGLSTLK